jgi:predicted metal-dependent hydrolase
MVIDWLLRSPREVPKLEVGGRALPVVLRRAANARRLTMRLAPDGSEVRITLPRWGTSAEALEFARSRASWLAAQIAALPKPLELGEGTAIPYLGEQLILRHDPAKPRKVRLVFDEIHAGGPVESLPARLSRWLEAEARALMEEDLAHYCTLANRPAPRLMLSRAKRRWGSCARDGTIRLNWRLVMAPEPVRRSVVAHEVAHLVHFDHSPAFHAFLDELFEGDLSAVNRWLKREGRGLYTPFG